MNKGYRKSICAFIDIMGYKNMINSVERGEIDAKTMINSLETIIKSCVDEHINNFNSIGKDAGTKYDIDYIVFSDSVIISAPILNNQEISKYTDKNQNLYSDEFSDDYIYSNYVVIWRFLLLIMDIQMLAIEHNILFRGAISTGNHYRSDRIMFSNALVKAYEAESNRAVYPRIILNKDSECELFGSYALINGLINDGLIIRDGEELFVDYIGRVNSMRHISPDYTSGGLLMHKKIVEDNLVKYRNNKQVLSKYIWLGYYHNYSEIYNDDKYNVDMSEFVIHKREFNRNIYIP